MTVGRVDALAAVRAGEDAARNGQPVTDCPYDVTAQGDERILARLWIRGYNSVRPAAT